MWRNLHLELNQGNRALVEEAASIGKVVAITIAIGDRKPTMIEQNWNNVWSILDQLSHDGKIGLIQTTDEMLIELAVCH